MKQYLKDLERIIRYGDDRGDRTGTGTRSIFGTQTRYDLSESFPAMTTKKLAWKAMVSELLWFIEGSGDERRLAEILHGTRSDDKKTIWTANAKASYWKGGTFVGDLGRVYGVQWRSWQTFSPLAHNEGVDGLEIGKLVETDQLTNVIDSIKNDPFGRRHIMTAWNPGEIQKMALPPCHILAQFNVSSDGRLSCQMYQRSADFFLGVPFNIASYALLTHMIAQVCDLEVGEFVHTIGDAHIYNNHMDQVTEQLNRVPDSAPQLWMDESITDINDFTMDSFKLTDYYPQETITAPMAV